jgi:hypothetical protein
MANVQGNVYGHSDAWGVPADFYAGSTLVTGSTINMQSALLVLNPPGTLAALTVNLPLNPPDGAWCDISSTQVITALTVAPNTGDTIVNGVLGAVTNLTPVASTGASASATIRYRYFLNGYQVGNTTVNPRTWVRFS